MAARRLITGLIAAICVASCSPGGGGQAPAFGPGPLPGAPSALGATTAAQGTVKVTIAVPKIIGSRSHYVSSATQSIVIDVGDAHRRFLLKEKHNLTPGTKGCTNTTKALTCSFEFQVPAGKDRFEIFTYDRRKGRGNVLSGEISFVHRVKAGKTTKLPLALTGVARSISWQLADAGYSAFETGNSASGFQFAGVDQRIVDIFALDADGNFIVGAGSPKLSLASHNTNDLEVTPISGNANEFVLAPHRASSVQLIATAKSLGSTTPSIVNVSIGSVLYVANHGSTTPGGSVTVYVPWSDTPVETITDGISNPGVLTVDNFGDVWVGNDAGSVSDAGSITEYSLGNTTPVRTISGLTKPVSSGRALAVDISGNVYCACNHGHEVDEFTPAGGSTPSRTLTAASSPTGISSPISVVTDRSGNLYVANLGSNAIGVSVFAPGTGTTPTRNITSGINGVTQLAVDSTGRVYAVNTGASPNTVTEYIPGTGTLSKALDSIGDLKEISGLAVDLSGAVYVPDSASPTNSVVTQFAAASSSDGTGSRTFVIHDAYIYATAVDGLSNVYVPLSNSSKVLVYPPGAGLTPSRTLTSGLDQPWDVTVWP